MVKAVSTSQFAHPSKNTGDQPMIATPVMREENDDSLTLDSVLASLIACQDTASLLAQLVEIIADRESADGCYVATLHPAGEHMEIVAAQGKQADNIHGRFIRKTDGAIGNAWRNKKKVVVPNTTYMDSIVAWPDGTQLYSCPLIVDDEVVAALSVISEPTSADLMKDIPLLDRICSMATIAISNTRLIEATQRSLQGTRALAELSQSLMTINDQTDASDEACRMALTAVQSSRACCFLIDPDGQLLPHVSWSIVNGVVYRARSLPKELVCGSIANWCVENNQHAVLSRHVDDARESAPMHELRKQLQVGSCCCLPLRKNNTVIGAIMLGRSDEQPEFDQRDVDVLKAMVNQLAISIERLELEQELEHQAYHDRLTKLSNRHHFEMELSERIRQAEHDKSEFSVLFIDLDGFKAVNDSLGHAAGDELLTQVSGRLLTEVTANDLVARMGGDEFAVIVDTHSNALDLAHNILSAMNLSFDVFKETVKIGASIGVSRYPDDGKTMSALLHRADEAMYQAKHGGKSQVFVFDESLAETARNRTLLENDMKVAIAQQQMRLVYQPQVRCSDGQVVGLEALVRWEHPEKGLLGPNKFVPLAEATGMINDIGGWVIGDAIRQLADWQSTSARDIRVCINIAASQFQLDDFCSQILGSLEYHSAPAHLLELEVTESVVMYEIASVVDRLNRLREAGVRIAIDDFGTGYSSLSYLQDLPLDVLKIDRAFVNRLRSESDQSSLVNTIMLLATGLGLETVAEGVEQQEQMHAVAKLGCDLIQGYLYSQPVPPEEVPATIARIHAGNLEDLVHLNAA